MFVSENKETLLIGETSYGHYQIEMSCDTCHTEAFGGEEVIQEACTSCHAQELKEAHDSHPRKKFTDPRNADLLEIVDARYCVSCHTEHKEEQTHEMGLTLPKDYCYHCHEDVVEERPSHANLEFDSCASAGCHNYHDNRALYESFLVDNANQPWVKALDQIEQGFVHKTSAQNTKDAESKTVESGAEVHEENVHTAANIPCQACHIGEREASADWLAKPGIEQCSSCHSLESETYLQGHHGMRLSSSLPPMTPGESRTLKFHSASTEMEQGCNSCHQAHDYTLEPAGTEACLSCHQDEHSLAFESSPHAKSAGLDMSCASCHMPRVEHSTADGKVWVVDHNQSKTLRPNEKMIRPVCMQCHSLEFSLDALADPKLIKTNFSGQPSVHIPSIDWALERDQQHRTEN